ncbi:MAG: S8 family serine peptidase [Candidatus Aenigmatarchaeota archaeon]
MINKRISFTLIFFLTFLFIELSFSNSVYLIQKEKLDEILKNNNFIILSKIKCYFDKICALDKPIKGFESYFFEDKKIFKIHRLESLSIIDAYRVWNTSFENLNLTGNNVKIAILDTGIDIYHRDLNYSLDSWKCFYSINENVIENNWSYCNDDNGHGTHVAGIIAARYLGNISKCFEGYPCGIAPNATLFIAKVFDSNGYANLIDILNALEWAVNNSVDIVSMSFGIDLSSFGLNSCYPLGNSSLERAIYLFNSLLDEISIKYNIIFVASIGNNPNSISSPACAKNVIGVGAINKNRDIAYFSSRGPIDNRIKPDIVAPGVNINSTFPINSYKSLSGTSMSAPFVSGALAILIEALRENNISFSSQELKAILLTSPNEEFRNNIFGSGVLNVSELIRIRNNFLTLNIEKNETLRFKVNKTDNYPFKFTIYRHERFEDLNLVRVRIIKDNNVIFENETFDNVFQYKNNSLSGEFYIDVDIRIINKSNASNEKLNLFTFAFSHKVLNLTEYLEEGLNNSIVSMLNVTIDSPIELKLNLANRTIRIFIRDFSGNPIVADKINITILNISDKIVSTTIYFNKSEINFTLPPNLNENYYKLYVIAEKEKRFGIAYTNFTYFSFEFLSPREILKVMNGDILNITLKFNYTNISVSQAYLYLENNTNKNISLNFSKENSIISNITIINLEEAGKYYLFLNISLDESNKEYFILNLPLIEFSSIFDYNISYLKNLFADKEYIFNVSIFHINGTKLQINKTLCIENSTTKIFCNSTIDDSVRILTNVSFEGFYNLTINVLHNSNYLNKSFPIKIEFEPNILIIELEKSTFTIFERLNLSARLINSTKNSECTFCKIFVNMTDSEGRVIFLNKELEEIKNIKIPKDFKKGAYNLTLFSKINPIIINTTQISIETLDISTNVSEMIFPNYHNVTINISISENANVSINITKYNVSGIFQINLSSSNIIDGCTPEINSEGILWCNQTNNIILSINSGETATFYIEIIVFGEKLNGYLLDKFYSGFLIRPIEKINRNGCDDIRSEDTLLNPFIRNHCFIDEKNQKDLAINKNEKIKFLAIAYAGATLDKNISVNVTINVTDDSNLTIFHNASSFKDLINFEISNFTKKGLYLINLTFEFNNITKIETYNLSVYELNFSIQTPKNYTKVNDILSIFIFVNRTNGVSEEIINNITSMLLLTQNAKIKNYRYDKSLQKIEVNISFSNPFFGDITLKIEDELGIESNITIGNLTAYHYEIEISYPETVFVDTVFAVKVSSKLLPSNINIQANYTIEYSGPCSLLSSKNILNTKEASFIFNATGIGECSIIINSNATYLDLFFESYEETKISILSPPKKTEPIELPQIQQLALLIRKTSDIIEIKENSWNTTVIFVTSIGRNMNVSAKILDYPEHLVQIIPSEQLIEANLEGMFLFNISLDKNETREEFNITILFNGSFITNKTDLKIKVIRLKTDDRKIELENEIRELEKEISKLENKIIELNRRELLDEILNIKNLLDLAKEELNRGNMTKVMEIISDIKNLINYVKSKLNEQQTEISEESSNFTFLLVILIIIVGVSAIVFILFIFPKLKFKKPYYDINRQKFIWTEEDESVWEKLKEKWRKKQ